METLVENILYNDPYARYQFHRFIKSLIFLFIAMLFLFSVNHAWDDIRPYTGNYNEYISIHGSTQKEQIDTLTNELELMPDWILNKFKADGGIIYLSSENLEEVKAQVYNIFETESEFQTIGFFNSDNSGKEIWIYSNVNDIKSATIHEFGHYFDNYCGKASDTEAFKKCYEAEKKQFKKIDSLNYHISTESEYFASCFLQYVKHNKTLKKYCPRTYVYMNNLLKLHG